MKLRLPNKLVAALMAAMSATVFTTLSTGSAAYASTTYDNLSTVDYFRTNAHVYNTGSGTFYLETPDSVLDLTLTVSLSGLEALQTVHDYANAGYCGSFVTWTYNNAAKTTYGMADISSDYNGGNTVAYNGFTGLSSSGTPWTTAGGISVDTLRTYANGRDLVTLTITNSPASNGVQVTALDSQGVAQTLYSGTRLKDSSCSSAHITAFTVNMSYVRSVTLNSTSTLSSGGFTPPIDYTQPFVSSRTDGSSVGRIMFLGDSITHGVEDMSYRWGLFKTFVDNGIENQIAGPLTNYNSKPLNSDFDGTGYASNTSFYGGALFENRHYAQASGRTQNMLTGSKSQNALGNSTGVDYSGVTSVQVGERYDADTYVMMMGTNDFLSDAGANTSATDIAAISTRLLGEGSLENGTWTNAGVESPLVGTSNDNAAYRGTWGTMGKIIENLQMDAGDKMYVAAIPVWGYTRANLRWANGIIEEYNEKLKAWTKAYTDTHTGTVTFVDVNRGLQDKTINGYYAPAGDVFFRITGTDYIHPNEQGALIIAGNLAQGMGLAGRTAGLARSAADGTGWTALGRDIHLDSGASERVFANVFTEANGYSVDFSAVFGNGSENGWLGKNNALSLYIGDGTNAGTLKLSEGYISWGDTILFCQDNSLETNERIRVAYHNGNEEQNISAGYYVWLGDMLIGQGLGNDSSLAFNGVTVYTAGAEADIKGLSYANTAYAPTTELTAGTPLTTTQAAGNASVIETGNVLLPLFNHDNATTLAGPTDFSSATQAGKSGNAVYVASTTASGDVVATYGSPISGNGSWFAAQGGNNVTHTGDLSLQLTEGASGAGLFGVVNTGTAGGDVTVQVDGADLSSYSTAAGTASIIGAYAGNITGKFTAVMNSGTLSGGIMGGFENASVGHHIGSVDLIVNGGTIGGSILGGSKVANGKVDGNIAITITGGTITGGIVGTGTAGTVGGDVNITITGGTIGGNVTARDNSVTMTKENATANLTVEGNLAKIGGNISADNVTFRNVETQEYSDTFDKFSGSVTAADTLTLDHYTAAQVGSAVSAQHVVLKGNSSTTIRNLTLTACTITAQDGSDVTLEGTLTLGNTATYSGTVYVANGLVFSMTDAALNKVDGDVTYSDDTSGFRSVSTATLLTPRDTSRLKAVGGAELTTDNVNTYTGTGVLEGATFSDNAGTGVLSAALADTSFGTTYYVNDAVIYDTNTSAYTADALVINNGGTLTFNTDLKDNVPVTIAESGAAIAIKAGKHIGGVALADGVTGFALSGAGELRLTSADAATMLTGVTGTGTMRLTQNAVLNGVGATAANPTKTLSTGTLIVGNGEGDRVQLQIGRTQTGGRYENNYATIKSFSNVVLDNGKLWYHTNNDNSALSLNNLTVTTGGGEIYIEDVNGNSTFALNGTTNLQGNLSLLSNWKNNAFIISNLTGEGDLSMGANNDNPQLQLNNISGWSGNLTHTKGAVKYYIGLNAADSKAHLSAFNVNGGTAEIHLRDSYYAKTVTIDSAVVASGATLRGYYAAANTTDSINIGTLTVNGTSATPSNLSMTNNAGQMHIDKLLGGSSSQLDIYSEAQTSNLYKVSLGSAGTSYTDENLFAGTLWLTSHSMQGSSSTSAINLSLQAEDVLKNATVKLDRWQNAYNNTRTILSLESNAKVAGINSTNTGGASGSGAYIRSGAMTVTAPNAATDMASTGAFRTLEIVGSGTYTSNARVMDKVNLVMSGTGSQTFSGDMSTFNGSVTVNSGTLALTGNSKNLAQGATVNGGTLTISGTNTTLGGTIANAGTLNLSGTVAVDTTALWNYEAKSDAETQPTYSDGVNGLLNNATFYLIKNNNGSVASSASFTGTTVTDAGAGNYTFTATDSSTYYINESAAYDAEKMGASTITKLYIAKDATLTDSVMPTSQKTLVGSGTYTAIGLENISSKVQAGADKDWTGIVELSGMNLWNSGSINLNTLGRSDSWVKLHGVTSVDGNWNSGTDTITANIILENNDGAAAWNINQGTSGTARTYTFKGAIKGTGSLIKTGVWKQNFTFLGDIGGWEGLLANNSDSTYNPVVTFGGAATTINVAMTPPENTTGKAVSVVLGDITNGASAYTFNKDVTVSTLTTNGHDLVIGDNATMKLLGNGDLDFVADVMAHATGTNALEIVGATGFNRANQVGNLGNNAYVVGIDTHISNDIAFNAWGKNNAIDNITLKKAMTVDGSMRLESQVRFAIAEGGSLTAQTLVMGHESAGNPGHLIIDGGDLSVGTIVLNGTATSAANTIVMNGGTWTHTTEGGNAFSGSGNTTVTLNGGTLKASAASWTFNHAATLGGDVTMLAENSKTLTVSGVLSGNGGLTKTGNGTLVLNAANTFTGDILVSEGTLKVGNDMHLALGAVDSTRRIVIGRGGVLDVNAREITDHAGYTVTLDGGTLTNSGGKTTEAYSQLITGLILTDDSTVLATSGRKFGITPHGEGTTSIDLGGHTLEKTGDGNFAVKKATITGGGTLKVTQNNLEFFDDVSLDANFVMNGGSVTANAGITLTDDISVTAATAGGSFGAAVKTEGHTLTVGGTANLTMSGAISGNGSLLKADSNTVTLTGANAYTGTTTVNAGELVYAGGSSDLGAIVMKGAASGTNVVSQVRFSKKNGTANSYTFTTLELSSGSNTGKKWLVVDEGVTVHATGDSVGSNPSSVINAWGLAGGGLEINGIFTTDALISMDGPGDATIKGTGTINTTGLNISNGSTTTLDGGLTINVTTDKGVYRRAGGDSKLKLGQVTLQAQSVDWHLKNSIATVELTDAEHGTTFEAANGHTITVDQALSGSGSFNKAGAGTVILKGNDTFTGNITIAEGTLEMRNAGGVTLNHVVQSSGNLVLAGNVNLNMGVDTQNATFTHGADNSYGYLTSAAIQIATGGTVNIDEVTAWSIGGLSATQLGLTSSSLNDTTVTLSGDGGSGLWFMNTGEGAQYTYDGTDENMLAIVINAKNDATLHLTSAPTALRKITVNDTTAKIDIAQGITLNNSQLSFSKGGTATLTGSGTFVAGAPLFSGNNLVMPSGVSVGDAASWDGAVSISGNLSQWLNGASLDNLSNANSWVEFNGISGVFNSSQTVNANIRFTDNGGEAAFKTTGGFSGKTFTFNGKVSGTGTYYLQGYNGGTQTFAFNGDASAWTGTLKSSNTNGTGNKIEISNAFGATLKNEAGNMQVTLSDAALAENAFTGDLVVEAGTMNVNGALNSAQVDATVRGGTLNLNDGGTMGSISMTGGALNVKNNTEATTLTMSGSSTLTIDAEKRLALTAAATAGDKAYGGVTGSGTLAMNLTTGDNGVQTGVTLGSTFTGTLELTGHLRAESDLGGTSLVKFSGSGAGLVFTSRHSGEGMQHENPFTRDIELADATTLSVSTWGNSGNTDNNIISGAITGESNTAIVKKDTGHLTISGDLSNFHGDVKAESGDLLITGAPESGYTLKSIHILGGNVNLAGGSYTIEGTNNERGLFTGNGKLTLESGASLLLNAHMPSNEDWQFEMQSGTNKGVAIEKGATFTLDTAHYNDTTRANVYNLAVAGVDAETPATITAAADRSYNIMAANITIADAGVTFSKETAGSFANKLQNSSFTNAGSTAIALTNGESTLTALSAQAGNITVENAANSADRNGDRNDTSSLKSVKAEGGDIILHLMAATSVSLNELVLKGGHSVSADTTTNTSPIAMLAEGDETTTYAANIKVGGTQGDPAKFEADGVSTINSNLTIAGNTQMVYSSSVPQGVEGGINLNGHSLTLSATGGDIFITDDMMTALSNTEHLTLFSNVGGLTLNGVDFAEAMTKVSENLYITAAGTFFGTGTDTPLALAKQYTVAYNTDTKELYLAPEPATTALSLLALTALAARRKRK